MKNLIKEYQIKIKDWSVRHVTGGRAVFWLAVFSFSEASFFLIPPDILLVAILSVTSQRWLYYSSLATIFSVLGGFLGYAIGFLFFSTIGEPIVSFYNLHEQMLVVSQHFSDNAFLAIFLSAFTPIPYKLFTISAGFFKIDLLTFFVASLLGRGMRFFSVGFIMKKFGKQMVSYILKYFDIISLLIILVVIIILLFV
ncbi:VTT domain-containing protein [Patescibacteria group bacterium]|nr:VTT domain-containing protein [Patescibacteria group bacterium]MCG2694926.1 VTT domain-containing protein [Candidatus Parcubacteria bacterium]